jgi:hypothetical protein
MRKKRTLLLCAACALLALLALLAYTFTTAEPSYDGHSLSYWVGILGNPQGIDGRPYENATNAIDHIGVAALPFAVKWLQYEPPQWRTKVCNWLLQRRFPFADRLSSWIAEPKTQQLASGTHYVFRVLGKRAMPAFADLCRLTNDTNRPYTARVAAQALGCLGTNALGPLLTVSINTQHPARLSAINALSVMPDLGDAVQLVLPAITNCLSPTNGQHAQVTAIFSVGNLKPQISVPVLVACLQNSNAMLRTLSATALGNLGPGGSSAVPALSNALTDPDRQVRQRAAQALHNIDLPTVTDSPTQ